MELSVAIARSCQILDEELSAPTVAYGLGKLPEGDAAIRTLVGLTALQALLSDRSRRPRSLNEEPAIYKFTSVNHDLLRALLSQISEPKRPAFLEAVTARLFWGVASKRNGSNGFPRWDGLSSELPLVVEFLTRNGGTDHLLRALESGKAEIIPGHVLMLMQVEDMIALNYTVLNDTEYERMRQAVQQFRARAIAFLDRSATKQTAHKAVFTKINFPIVGEISALRLQREIASICSGIIEECRKAQYLYLKTSLLEGLNLEINQDKSQVQHYLKQFGFSPLLSSSLDQADSLYQEHKTVFDSKSCLGHLRSFLENLQKETMPRIHAKLGGTLPSSWGSGLAYLRGQNILSEAEEEFASSLYRLISDEGVHPLVAEREYSRLARNMVIEYALLFLTKINKLVASP